MWVPETAKEPADPLTTPAVVKESPQLIAAVKLLAGCEVSLSVKFATVPLKLDASRGEVFTGVTMRTTPAVPLSEKVPLKVGGVAPPTMSVPMRSQSGSRFASRIQL